MSVVFDFFLATRVHLLTWTIGVHDDVEHPLTRVFVMRTTTSLPPKVKSSPPGARTGMTQAI